MGRVLFPRIGFTTDDLAAFYQQIAPALLRHLAKRPVTLKRFPEDVTGESFWEKDAPGFTPVWVQRMPVPRKGEAGMIDYVCLKDARSLRWAASVGAVELHTFLHRYPYITQPTAIVLDLDPGDGVHLPSCCAVALQVREWFGRFGLECFAKVSGSKGLQVYVPLNTRCSYVLTEWIARRAADELERRNPRRITADMARPARTGKVFIDWSQNADYKTTVCVYSVRASRNRPYVSVPLTWAEVERADMHHLVFSPEDALERVRKMGDLFAPVLVLQQEIPAEWWQQAGVDPAEKPKAVRTTKAQRATHRTSRQGGKKSYSIAKTNQGYALAIEHDGDVMIALFHKLPLRKADEVRGIATGHLMVERATAAWDEGTYEVVEGSLKTNVVKAYFSGRRLKGEWLLAVGPQGWVWRNNGGRVSNSH